MHAMLYYQRLIIILPTHAFVSFLFCAQISEVA